MSFTEQSGTPRRVKLAWIAFVCAMLGALLVEVLGAQGHPLVVGLIGIPMMLGLAFGIIGFEPSGETRNRKVVLWMAAAVGVILVCVAAIFTHALLNSTDL